ncbi:MAG: hypothetical protein MUE74_13490 [Bacteroidales bacterium]|jgi:hypothetical protein|nr:hypothetical protein [Bacteroidales bacterium]
MVLRGFIRFCSGTAGFILLVLLFSCEELVIVDCTECLTDEPLKATLQIRMEDNQQGVKINIYEGDLEDDVLFRSITTYSRAIFQDVPLNKSYTISAEYVKGDKTYVVVDSVRPRVKYTEAQCDIPCYYIYDNIIEMFLKNL